MLPMITKYDYPFKELEEIENFLQEADTLEELFLRTVLIKVPNYTYAIINNQGYYFRQGKWHEDPNTYIVEKPGKLK